MISQIGSTLCWTVKKKYSMTLHTMSFINTVKAEVYDVDYDEYAQAIK